jgi:hypothetical protein
VITATRIVIVLVALGMVFGAYWTLLPIVRAAMLPVADPAHGLLWVIGPAHALRFGAATILSALTLPIVLIPFRSRWRATPTAMPVNSTALLIRGALLFGIYTFCGAFYFTAYVEVRTDTITLHSPLGARTYDYARAASLEHLPPAGGQPDRYAIRFDDDRWGYFDADDEGIDAATVLAIAAHVSQHTGRPWIEMTTR